MAEVTDFRNNATPFPVYGCMWTIVFPILLTDGTYLSSAAGLDSEISKNGDTFADCTSEATEIGTSGIYYLTLTGTEMTADIVTVKIKTSSTDAIHVTMVLYPRKLVTIASGTCQGGAAGYMTLQSNAAEIADYYNGCLVIGSLDTKPTECRIISDYNGVTKNATVVPDWDTTPDSNDTYVIKALEGMQIYQSNLVLINHLDRGVTGFERACNAIAYGACLGTPTTTTITTSMSAPTPLATDQFKGQVIAFDNATTTAALRGQRATISGNTSGGVLSIVAGELATAPASGDTFTIE